MKVLLTGSRGYIGRPLVLKLLKQNHQVIGIDNCAREKWVERVGGNNYIPFEIQNNNYSEIIDNLTDKDFVDEIFKIHKPEIIINCSAQPSMPYSHLSWERALFTQLNNLSMNLNLLWGIKENGLTNTRYIITTTTGIAGQYYENVPEDHTLNMAGSWYHISRGFDSANCNLASRQWGIQIVEFRTSIVYGIMTSELKKSRLITRFETDFYFGTVLNRFIKQGVESEPLTIYGKGDQTKPFISLEDCCQSIINAIEHNFTGKHTILNQTTETISIKELAEIVKEETNCELIHKPNPRMEKEDFKMVFDNKKFLEVLGKPRQLIRDGIRETVKYFKK